MAQQLPQKMSYAFLREKASMISDIWQRRRRLLKQRLKGPESEYHVGPLATPGPGQQHPQQQEHPSEHPRRQALNDSTPQRVNNHPTILPSHHSLPHTPQGRNIVFLMFGRIRGPPPGNRKKRFPPFPKPSPQFHPNPNRGKRPCPNGNQNRQRTKKESPCGSFEHLLPNRS